MRPTATALAVASAWLAWPRPALAGMPSITLSEMASARLQVISFFLLVLLLCAWAVQGIWNGLRADVPRLPRLAYCKAIGVVTLWALLFVLVLTMISGARELMTPGAWKKQGLIYKLADEPPAPVTPPSTAISPVAVRREKLERLRAALWQHARAHDAHFPADDTTPEIAAEVWQLPDAPGLRYLYVGGRESGEPGKIVAYEPGVYGRDRHVLMADGEVRIMTVEQVRKALGEESR